MYSICVTVLDLASISKLALNINKTVDSKYFFKKCCGFKGDELLYFNYFFSA